MKQQLSDYERYLKPIHLKGKEVTLTIVKFTEEETHPQRGQAKAALVVWFRELPFGMILSPTNRQILYRTHDALAEWIGQPITVKAIDVGKVGGVDRSPIRVINTRPIAPRIEPATGEIVPPAVAEVVPAEGETAPSPEPSAYPEQPEKLVEAPRRELDEYFSMPPEPSLMMNNLPTTEAEYAAWIKQRGWNGKETREVLGTDAKSWMKMNGKGWADVAKTIAAKRGNAS